MDEIPSLNIPNYYQYDDIHWKTRDVQYDHIELKIPNTTNAIDGHFADLKNKLRNHKQTFH